MKPFVMQSSPLHCYLVLLGLKFLPLRPPVEYPEPIFLPQFDRPSVTPICLTLCKC